MQGADLHATRSNITWTIIRFGLISSAPTNGVKKKGTRLFEATYNGTYYMACTILIDLIPPCINILIKTLDLWIVLQHRNTSPDGVLFFTRTRTWPLSWQIIDFTFISSSVEVLPGVLWQAGSWNTIPLPRFLSLRLATMWMIVLIYFIFNRSTSLEVNSIGVTNLFPEELWRPTNQLSFWSCPWRQLSCERM